MDRYEILSELGVGGFGAVYKAHQKGLNKEVAVKVLLPSAASIEGAAARFRREAMLAKELSHPNTIQLYDYGQTEDGLTFIAMELLDGHELEEEIKVSGPMPPERVKRIASQVLKSLAEAHAHGIVHRDLKPSNIMLVDVFGESDFVKVLDFGIARAFADHQEDFKTRTGTIIGTPQYMSPEQLRNDDLGPPTDIYALGLIMAEMLTGKPVFHSENTNLIIVAQLSPGDPPLTEEVLRGPLGKVIYQATTKSLAKRYKTAIEMLNALDRAEAMSTGEVAAVMEEVRRPEAFRKPPSGPVAAGVAARPEVVPQKRSKALPILLVILVVLGVGIGGAMVLFNRSEGPSSGETGGDSRSAMVPGASQTVPLSPEQLTAMEEARTSAQEIWRMANRICMWGSDTAATAIGQVRLMLLTNQPGARVYRGETYLGTTPFNGEVPAGSSREQLTIRLDGYRDSTVTVDLTQAAMPDTINLVPLERERPRDRDRTARQRETETRPREERQEVPSQPPRQPPASEPPRATEQPTPTPTPTPAERPVERPAERPSIGLIDELEAAPEQPEQVTPPPREEAPPREQPRREPQPEEEEEEEEPEPEPAREEPAPTPETPPQQGSEANIPILF